MFRFLFSGICFGSLLASLVEYFAESVESFLTAYLCCSGCCGVSGAARSGPGAADLVDE